MASRLLCGRLCFIIAIIISLFLPLTFSTNNDALAQSPLSHAEEMIRKGYESHVEFYTACINTQPPPGITIECGPPPRPPTPLQPLSCEQLGTCHIPCTPDSGPQLAPVSFTAYIDPVSDGETGEETEDNLVIEKCERREPDGRCPPGTVPLEEDPELCRTMTEKDLGPPIKPPTKPFEAMVNVTS